MKTLIRITMGIMFAVIVASCFSCSPRLRIWRNVYFRKIMNACKDNLELTEKTYLSLVEKNGNAFYFEHCAGMSVVWSYTDEKIEIYDLKYGEIISYREGFTSTGKFLNLDKETIKEIETEIGGSQDNDNVVTDKFSFLIKLNTGVEEHHVFLSEMGEFLTKEYKFEVLNKIVEDINTYRIWCFICSF